ncbi:hypothetical protein HY745_00390 [Candidatus Desantisbacteria bacterium]|nr:hypothetical protein [Candidatus Desantisbacteria bacterium]
MINNMEIFLKKIVLIFLFFLYLPINLTAFDNILWRTLKTEHLTVFYKPGYEIKAREALKTLEYYRLDIEKLTGNKNQKFSVVIEDEGTISDGLANPLTYSMSFSTYPPLAGELGFTENWFSDVGIHEYTHLNNLTKAGGTPGVLTNLFGNLLFPNILLPDWAIEGFAVYSESQFSRYQGRLNDGFYDAYIGACVNGKRFPSILKATYSPLEFPYYNGSYIFGSEFFQYLSKIYGQEKLTKFFDIYSSSLLSYLSPVLPYAGIDRASEKIYGKSFPLLWREWNEYENKRFENFSMEGEKLTDYGWFIDGTRLYNNNLYFKRRYPVKTGAFDNFWFNEITKKDLSNNKEETIVSTSSSFTGQIKIYNDKLYYTVFEIKSGYANTSFSGLGYYSIIHEKDLLTGKDSILLSDEIRTFDILPDGDILYFKDKKQEFGTQISIYKIKTGEKKLVFETDFIIDDIALDEKRIVVSARKDWENFSLYILDLKEMNLTPLIHTPFFETHLTLSENKLFFTANYEKTYSIYCYDFESNKIFRLTKNGFSDFSAFDKKGQLYFIGINSNGFDIYKKKAEFDEFKIPDFPVSKKPSFILKESDFTKGGYGDNLKTLFPPGILRLPIISSDSERTIAGFIFAGGDALGHFPGYYGTIYYDSKEKDPQFSINFPVRLFVPFYSYINLENIEENSLKFDLTYPFINRLSPGISNLSAGLTDNFTENFEKLEMIPHVSLNLRYPGTFAGLSLKLPVEKKNMGSDINRTGIYADAELSQYLPLRNKLLFRIKGIDDRDNPDTIFPKIRGYTEIIEAKKGGVFSFEYTRPLFHIRKGIWNPNIFFEDLNLVFFIDSAIPYKDNNDTVQFSNGLEFLVETKTFLFASLNSGIRLSINKEKETRVELLIQSVIK